METFTTEMLQTIYERANQFAITKYGKGTPDRLELQSDGTICATWIEYHCGNTDEDNEYISAEDLTADLDQVAIERLEREAKERQERIERENKARLEREAREKEQRRAQYLQLKKEFE